MIIRATEPQDHDVVLAVVRAAFSTGGRDGQEEVDIVTQTWARAKPDAVIDLVAGDGQIVQGHVLGAPGNLGLLAVAPLAVHPDHQARGVGGALMRSLLAQADDAGWPAVVLLGNPAYYSRFGFEPAGDLVYAPVGKGNPAFQIKHLSGVLPAGEFVYCWESDPIVSG